MIENSNDRDSANRAFNEAAIAKHLVLSGADTSELLRHIDAALSWSLPLLGVRHPMSAVADPLSPYVPLRLKDRVLLDQDT
jgi:hypothetical protein